MRPVLLVATLWGLFCGCSHRAANDIFSVPDSGSVSDSGGSADFGDQQERQDSSSPDVASTGQDAPISFDAEIDAGTLDVTVGLDSSSGADVLELDSAANAAMTVSPESAELVAISPEGAIPPAASSASIFHVRNPSGTPTGKLRTSINPSTAQFKIENDACDGAVLTEGSACDVSVSFAPLLISKATAILVITDSSSGTAVTASLTGTTTNGTCLAVAPSQANLGSITPGHVSSEVTFAINNGCSGYDLGSVSATLTGRDVDVFRVSSNTCTNLARQSSCAIGVVLAPRAGATVDIIAANLNIAGSHGGLQQVSLSGAVLGASDPDSPNPSSVSFGTTFVGQPVVRIVTIRNLGTASIEPLTTTLNGTGMTQVTVAQSNCGGVLAPAAFCQLKLQYLPTNSGGVNGTLTVGTGSAALTISLAGVAQEPPADAGSID